MNKAKANRALEIYLRLLDEQTIDRTKAVLVPFADARERLVIMVATPSS